MPKYNVIEIVCAMNGEYHLCAAVDADGAWVLVSESDTIAGAHRGLARSVSADENVSISDPALRKLRRGCRK